MDTHQIDANTDGGCERTRSLVTPYLDGELSEAQAGPLRRHLLDCPACRSQAQGGRSLKRWFTPEAEASVPSGFAARVARRAFAGDTGERGSELESEVGVALEQGRLLSFVLRITAAAALVLICLSLASRFQELPAGHRLRASEPGRSTEEVLRRLDELERQAEIDRRAELNKRAELVRKAEAAQPQ